MVLKRPVVLLDLWGLITLMVDATLTVYLVLLLRTDHARPLQREAILLPSGRVCNGKQ